MWRSAVMGSSRNNGKGMALAPTGNMNVGLAEECIGAAEDKDKRVASWFYLLYPRPSVLSK